MKDIEFIYLLNEEGKEEKMRVKERKDYCEYSSRKFKPRTEKSRETQPDA